MDLKTREKRNFGKNVKFLVSDMKKEIPARKFNLLTLSIRNLIWYRKCLLRNHDFQKLSGSEGLVDHGTINKFSLKTILIERMS